MKQMSKIVTRSSLDIASFFIKNDDYFNGRGVDFEE